MNNLRRTAGFTLVEMIMVVLILSIAALSILNAFSAQGRGLLIADNDQIAQNMVQECAAYIARSKHDGVITYAGITSSVCNGLPVPTGFSSVTVTPTGVTSAAVAACPTNASCKDTTISASKNGTVIATTKILFVNY